MCTTGVSTHTHKHICVWSWPPPLSPVSHAAASQASECVSHSVQMLGSCWLLLSALLSDILHLSREAGQPCRTNVKHMWNSDGGAKTSGPAAGTHARTPENRDDVFPPSQTSRLRSSQEKSKIDLREVLEKNLKLI